MKRILGLDLGTTSIGWALVEEHNGNEESKIIKLGVRVNPLTVDEKTDFEKGKPLSINSSRTLKRGARRNLQRFKLRRKALVDLLKQHKILLSDEALTELGQESTHQTLSLRAKAAREKVEKGELARILLLINKKRGYKSSRKAKNDDEGTLIDGMSVAKQLYDEQLTPGQLVLNLMNKGKNYVPDFYRSDLQDEFDQVWNTQLPFHADVLTDELYQKLQGQGQQSSRKLFYAIHQITTVDLKGKRDEKKKQHYTLRSEALEKKLTSEEVAFVLVEINNQLNNSSGYLGAISDRSKTLFFDKKTVGEYLFEQIKENNHTRLKSQVFFRQDYLDEFEQIWETQAQFHPELTAELKTEIRDVVIFYQRRLKSQKHLISLCEFEKHHKVVPKSSPLFQEFKIWHQLNNLEFGSLHGNEKRTPKLDLKELLFAELNIRGTLKADEILKLSGLSKKEWKCNLTEGIDGNKTNEVLYNAYQKIAEYEGYGFDWAKKSVKYIKNELLQVFPELGINPSILNFDAAIGGNEFDKQISFQLWHLLYSAEDDAGLKEKLNHEKFGFPLEYTQLLTNVSFSADYGSLSAKAIRKILPFLKQGLLYNEACAKAGYNHSHSLTREELDQRELKQFFEKTDLKRNSLRNPVVEKILWQMMNVYNQVVENYGEIDEVRVELARELKKTAKQRDEMTKQITAGQKRNDEIRKILQTDPDFRIKNPTKNDVVRYKLYEELKDNGYRSIYTNEYIPRQLLFSEANLIDIDHIIPQAMQFDDSFSNKVLAYRKVNLKKSDTTAYDFIQNTYNTDFLAYKNRVDDLKKKNLISSAKHKKLLMSVEELPDSFIERDIKNTQYIAKEAARLLKLVARDVYATSGTITNKLREDWGLINVMKELNLPKYRALGMTENQERKHGKNIELIKDWTKRNDHRHHAMDALAVAFTSHAHVQYINTLNASRNEKHKDNKQHFSLKNTLTHTVEDKNGSKKRRFIAPMPRFREQAKVQLESVLISYKTKNKVTTINLNKTKIKGKDQYKKTPQLTPRGQLHKETVYGKINNEVIKTEKISAKLTEEKILQITKPLYREVLLKRLKENNNDPKKAFAGKNSWAKNPIYLDDAKQKTIPELVKLKSYEDYFIIRKDISKENFGTAKSLDKIIDQGIKKILQVRLAEFGNKAQDAFSDLEKNPIWLNKEKGIAIKRVAIKGVNNTEALHSKKDHLGKLILDEQGKTIPNDFVSTGNNHHVAIYKDEKGKLHEKVVSFYEAVARKNEGLSIVDKEYKSGEGWQLLFTLKQNEFFVFPTDEFNPHEMDLLKPEHATAISPHLFRVQKISTKNYLFTHHLETKATDGDMLKDKKELSKVTYHSVRNTEPLRHLIKVRVNHIGQIVEVGEY